MDLGWKCFLFTIFEEEFVYFKILPSPPPNFISHGRPLRLGSTLRLLEAGNFSAIFRTLSDPILLHMRTSALCRQTVDSCKRLYLHPQFSGLRHKMVISSHLYELIFEDMKEKVSWNPFWCEFRFCALSLRWVLVGEIEWHLICLHACLCASYCQFWQLGLDFLTGCSITQNKQEN